MSLLDAPLWLQVALAAEALALVVLTARFGGRGLLVGVLASVVVWYALGLGASFLVSRLEGGAPLGPHEFLPGALLATARLAQAAAPLVAVAAVVGGLFHWRAVRRKPKPR